MTDAMAIRADDGVGRPANSPEWLVWVNPALALILATLLVAQAAYLVPRTVRVADEFGMALPWHLGLASAAPVWLVAAAGAVLAALAFRSRSSRLAAVIMTGLALFNLALFASAQVTLLRLVSGLAG